MSADVRDLEQTDAATVRLDPLKGLAQPHFPRFIAAFPFLNRRAVREVIPPFVHMQAMSLEMVVEL